ncbi:MAG: single-stranded DNA-binding protein [Syntrophorhabdus aromaticivorans]|jgi:single-strand DNA-binding protein|uniref:Single-stranded DNA-binding protein n=1 Tax=Syntrophorhabdus aromaticivorans TaxID=328301 RepID=A0A971M7A3_9BACT|nr:single-stranded DNA-binding protein [Syntrophorhabdus aromaticivorans]
MEQLNSVTLRGIIGNARIQNIGDTEMARFSVATDHIFKNRSGEVVCETTWHQCTAFKSEKMPDFSSLVKGAGVEVKGRLRNNRFTDSNGVERTVTEILASQVSVIGGTLQ